MSRSSRYLVQCKTRFWYKGRFLYKDFKRHNMTKVNIRTWLPGDNLYDDTVLVPSNMPRGEYDLQIGILNPLSNKPKVKLAISGKQPDGWYYLGKIKIGN